MTRKINLKSFSVPKYYLKFLYFEIQILHGVKKMTRKIKMRWPQRFEPTTSIISNTTTITRPLVYLLMFIRHFISQVNGEWELIILWNSNFEFFKQTRMKKQLKEKLLIGISSKNLLLTTFTFEIIYYQKIIIEIYILKFKFSMTWKKLQEQSIWNHLLSQNYIWSFHISKFKLLGHRKNDKKSIRNHLLFQNFIWSFHILQFKFSMA